MPSGRMLFCSSGKTRFFHGGEARPEISVSPVLSWEHNCVFEESPLDLKTKLCVRVCTRASVGTFPYSSLRKSKLAIYSNVLSQVPSEWFTSHDPRSSPPWRAGTGHSPHPAGDVQAQRGRETHQKLWTLRTSSLLPLNITSWENSHSMWGQGPPFTAEGRHGPREPPTPPHTLPHPCTGPEGLPGEEVAGGVLASLLCPSSSPPRPRDEQPPSPGADQGMVRLWTGQEEASMHGI